MRSVHNRVRRAAIAVLGLLVLPAYAESWPAGAADPTRPASVRDVPSEQGSGLSAIRITPQAKSAVIDGRTVRVGDSVRGAVVAEIRPNEVVLRRGGATDVLRLIPPLSKQPSHGTGGQ
jgi:hypothetical protein